MPCGCPLGMLDSRRKHSVKRIGIEEPAQFLGNRKVEPVDVTEVGSGQAAHGSVNERLTGIGKPIGEVERHERILAQAARQNKSSLLDLPDLPREVDGWHEHIADGGKGHVGVLLRHLVLINGPLQGDGQRRAGQLVHLLEFVRTSWLGVAIALKAAVNPC